MELHLACMKCRKHDCNVEVRCDECFDWSVDCFTACVRHQSKLKSKLIARVKYVAAVAVSVGMRLWSRTCLPMLQF